MQLNAIKCYSVKPFYACPRQLTAPLGKQGQRYKAQEKKNSVLWCVVVWHTIIHYIKPH